MSSIPDPPREADYRSRVQRSQWLSDLASALDRAERLTAALESDSEAAVQAAALRARIGLVRATLALVRAGRSKEIDPNWLEIARQLAPLSGDVPLNSGLDSSRDPDPDHRPWGKSPPPPNSSR